MKRKIIIPGKEFVKKVLEGERDFKNIKLEPNFDFHSCEGFSDMQRYLKNENLYENPIILNGSELIRIKAQELYIPFTKARNVVFDHVDLSNAYIECCDLTSAEFRGSILDGSHLRGSNMKNATLLYTSANNTYFEETVLKDSCIRGCKMKRANFERSDLESSDFRNADLIKAKFEEANLKHACFKHCYLERVDFWSSNMKGGRFISCDMNDTNFFKTNIERACFIDSDMRNVTGLASSINLRKAEFENIKVDSDTAKIIEKHIPEAYLIVME